MHNWKCSCCNYFTESERCPSCKYANCRGCHLLQYMHTPPIVCPSCKQRCNFIDISDDAETIAEHKNTTTGGA
jgi:hypothetical protein